MPDLLAAFPEQRKELMGMISQMVKEGIPEDKMQGVVSRYIHENLKSLHQQNLQESVRQDEGPLLSSNFLPNIGASPARNLAPETEGPTGSRLGGVVQGALEDFPSSLLQTGADIGEAIPEVLSGRAASGPASQRLVRGALEGPGQLLGQALYGQPEESGRAIGQGAAMAAVPEIAKVAGKFPKFRASRGALR